MESLVDDLVVTCDEIVGISQSATIESANNKKLSSSL